MGWVNTYKNYYIFAEVSSHFRIDQLLLSLIQVFPGFSKEKAYSFMENCNDAVLCW